MNISRHQDRPAVPQEAFGSLPPTATKHRTPGRATDRYAAIHQSFGWKVPKRFNMAQACCGQWAAQAATAARERSLRFIVLSPVRKKSHAQVLMQHAHFGGQLLRAEGLHHLAMLHHVKPIRQGRGKPEVLFHHDDREALGLEGLDHAG